MVAAIIACEIGFWVLLGGGLLARYVLNARRLSATLLLAVPLVDVVLLAVAAVDLRRGGAADTVHGLAAVYLGTSIAFGHQVIGWADRRVAHWFGGGPAKDRPPRVGREHAAHERRQWLRHLLAYLIAAAVLGVFTPLAGGVSRAVPLWAVMAPWAIVLAVDFVISFSYTLAPRRPKTPARETRR
jgi:hypothetical protein